MKILLVASQHGNEYLGEKLYEYIQKERPELLQHIEYVVANPQARAKRIRYLASDMNRSYNGNQVTHEEQLASALLDKIRSGGYDLVLDLHTTACQQPDSLILASINSKNRRFLQASSIQHFVIMEKKIASTALNGVVPESVSVEVNQDISQADLDSLCDDIERFIANEASKTQKFIYKASPLNKNEVDPEQLAELHNFELSNQGFYPILVGETAYQKHGYEYVGFKATKRTMFKV